MKALTSQWKGERFADGRPKVPDLVRYVWSARAANAGKPTDIRIGNLLVFQRQQGQWKLLARQASKL